VSSSIALRGITTGTPVPHRDREQQHTRSASEVKVEQWTPEQVEEYLRSKYGRPASQGNPEPSEAMESPKAEEPKQEEAVVEMTKPVATLEITLERYLELRQSGLSRSAAGRKLGLSPNTFYAFLRQWGIKDRVKEDLLLDHLRGGQSPAKLSAQIEVSATTERNRRDGTEHQFSTRQFTRVCG
jgi:hypothetical protein